ncbi:hypothetical protein BH24CHL1_BH24CHL1_11770 [soil metagenome]
MNINSGEYMDTHSDRPVGSISGEHVALGPMRRDLLDTYLCWFNDMRVLRTLNHPRQTTREELVASFDALMSDDAAESFTMYELVTWLPVGNVGLTRIDPRPDRRI